MRTLIVVPARYGSTRFPGKPLHEIAGHTLLERVYRIAASVAGTHPNVSAVVATDDARIEAHCADIGASSVMTCPDLPSGTDRALAAARMQDTAPDFVVNLQGDAPFTPPEQVSALISAAAETGAPVVTPVVRLSWEALDTVRQQKKAQPFSGTSCVRGADGRAFWFSKNILPAIRKEDRLRADSPLSPVFRHIGLYGYTLAALEQFITAPVGHYEALEGLEQLRFLENGMAIQTIEVEPTSRSMWGVDTPEDAAYAEALIAEHGDPLEAL
ncbi:MAG: manno-octulosonate cytidylyltransferase [Pseudomonadota bacterium]